MTSFETETDSTFKFTYLKLFRQAPPLLKSYYRNMTYMDERDIDSEWCSPTLYRNVRAVSKPSVTVEIPIEPDWQTAKCIVTVPSLIILHEQDPLPPRLSIEAELRMNEKSVLYWALTFDTCSMEKGKIKITVIDKEGKERPHSMMQGEKWLHFNIWDKEEKTLDPAISVSEAISRLSEEQSALNQRPAML